MKKKKVRRGRSARVLVFAWDDELKTYRLLTGVYLDGAMKTGKHGFPGGGANPGERIRLCVLRELLEETGLRAKLVTGIKPWKKVFERGGRQHATSYYVAFLKGPPPKDWVVEASDEMADLAFVPVRDLGKCKANMLSFDTEGLLRGIAYVKGLMIGRRQAMALAA